MALYNRPVTTNNPFCSSLMLGGYGGRAAQANWSTGQLATGNLARIGSELWPACQLPVASWPVGLPLALPTASVVPHSYPMLSLLLLAAAIASPTPANDICLAMIPPRLSAQIAREHPDYVLPRLTDAPVDRLMAVAESGGWPCPFVAIADVDGDGALDRAVLLKHKSQPTVRLLAARHVDGVWRIDLQKDWPIPIAGASVEPLEAGLYEQTKAGRDTAAQLDNLNAIQSDNAGFLAGRDESAKAAFFFQNAKWQELWVED